MIILKVYGKEWRCLWVWSLVEPRYRFILTEESVDRGELVGWVGEPLLEYCLRREYRQQLLAELEEPDRPNAYWDGIEENQTEEPTGKISGGAVEGL